MKKIVLVLLAVTLLGLAVGCKDGLSFTVEELEGTWNFPDQGGYTAITAFILTDATGADIGWEDGTYSYWCWGDGTYQDGVLTGTYDYNADDSSIDNNDTSGLDLTITISFTLDNNKLSMTCIGTGPLNGKTFTQGVFQPI
jgi:hypothetical protein